MTKSNKHVAVYLRTSTTGQNIEFQRAELQRWLDADGITNAVWYADSGSTGDNLQRPEFERLQQDVFAGRVSTIVVFKLDRISRSLSDGIATLTAWLEKDVRLVSTSQSLDFRGTVSRMIASLLFSVRRPPPRWGQTFQS